MTDLTDPIDPARPWVRDPRDDLNQMNWWATLFNPFGTSPKLHFTRAWTLMFMGRLLSVLVPYLVMAVIGMAGGKSDALTWLYIPAMIIFPLTIFTSLIVHIRRLADGRKPVVLAALVFLPLLLGFGGFLANGYMALGSGKAAQETQIEQAEGSETADAAESDTQIAEKTDASEEEEGGKGQPPSPQQMVQGGIALGAILWMISGIAVMLWSLIYVARIPNGGEGRFTTESVAQGRSADKPDYEGV